MRWRAGLGPACWVLPANTFRGVSFPSALLLPVRIAARDGLFALPQHILRQWHAQQSQRIAPIDFSFVLVRQLQILDRADAFADEHRPAFRVEWTVACE